MPCLQSCAASQRVTCAAAALLAWYDGALSNTFAFGWPATDPIVITWLGSIDPPLPFFSIAWHARVRLNTCDIEGHDLAPRGIRKLLEGSSPGGTGVVHENVQLLLPLSQLRR